MRICDMRALGVYYVCTCTAAACFVCWSMKSCVVVLSLLWSLVEVHSQTEYPYVSFMGQNLSNNSYVNLTLVGEDDGDPGNTVRCITDLATCCSSAQGTHRGDWFFPINETLVGGIGDGGDIYSSHHAQQISLNRRNSATLPSGIYRCTIPTNAFHDDTNFTAVYVGLYANRGKHSHWQVTCILCIFCSVNKIMYAIQGKVPWFVHICCDA